MTREEQIERAKFGALFIPSGAKWMVNEWCDYVRAKEILWGRMNRNTMSIARRTAYLINNSTKLWQSTRDAVY